jgi:prophage regulatory protein
MTATATVQTTDQKPDYARASRAAKHFQISRSTLWQWVKEKKRDGFPQPLKASSRVTLFDIAAIDRYLQSQAAK